MTLILKKGLRLGRGYVGVDDPDAEAYITAVETADQAASPGVAALETATKVAIHSFVKGCKADKTWPAIKASCILVGARTLAGALVPLVGAAPTNFNFVAGDYNRKTGLVGNGSNKYLNSNRNNNADPQNNEHMSVYVTTPHTGAGMYIGAGGSTGATGATHFNSNGSNVVHRNRSSIFLQIPDVNIAGFMGFTRANSASFNSRYAGTGGSTGFGSQTPFNGNIQVFANEAAFFGNGRLAFYSIGESLDLALLDARVTALVNALAVAIP
jgi:hypothetical protein